MLIIMYQHNKQKRRVKGICLVRSQGSLNLEGNLQLLFTLILAIFSLLMELWLSFCSCRGLCTHLVTQYPCSINDIPFAVQKNNIDRNNNTE
ncbi:hypothetical protein JHK82_020743 [Glycine max]|uniref:Uncharacterized protein n=2 Tax=Glycine subgen. Soja TaxID=1462606 RepID=A0A0R0IPF5_SOYBN|nr:hypothetical protein JHK87_020641 [Glycine soja]KAG5015051.1 hypothetical protein JHK85_021187 [Glycine max]KAG5024840.1 hypothetical protein JHK86_020754 [Glycine max]KAG5136012.1 hypothetical protein JHK82_020743 [Glycine max]KAH1050138.1 hypothetical protein GYH30_020559 [Glycine max]